MLGDLQQLFIDAFDQNLEGLSPTGVWKHASPLSDLQRPFFGDLNQILENESLLGDLQQFFIDAVKLPGDGESKTRSASASDRTGG